MGTPVPDVHIRLEGCLLIDFPLDVKFSMLLDELNQHTYLYVVTDVSQRDIRRLIRFSCPYMSVTDVNRLAAFISPRPFSVLESMSDVITIDAVLRLPQDYIKGVSDANGN